MNGQQRILLLTYMVAIAITVSLAFNIDITSPDVYTDEPKDFFGYKVLQYKSGTDKGIMVTAPLRENGSGAICKLTQDQPIQCFSRTEISLPNSTIPVKHLGLSIAKDSKRSEFTVCSPSVIHECHNNSYVNSVCYNITDQLQEISSFRPLFQECIKKTVDLVFLFDGSASMTEKEFIKNKEFIQDIMKTLENTSIKFAALQFSTDVSKVFDFNDSGRNGAYINKLKKARHAMGLTNTHKALEFVLDQVLENSDVGASPDATKVVMIITDGDPTDEDINAIIKRYDDKNIIRLVIAGSSAQHYADDTQVKSASLDKFQDIASKPKEQYAFKIENYDGLKGVLENFQKKIFKIEGTKEAQAGDMTDEMSQTGFSAIFYNDRLILGSVGSNSWQGSLQDIHGKTETPIKDELMEMDSYMGYSIAVGKKSDAPLYFTGAPRYNHTGQVILFTYFDKKWQLSHRINGKKMGSYFGAELCSVDVNSDGNTDFLLVGAPLFYQAKKEGRIYIYTLTDEMQLENEWNLTATSMGRFGSTISSLSDLNGDKLRDVAVGAPLEDDNRGAVYIYLGDKHRGIRSTFSQKIMGQKIQPGLRFFGHAIDGDIDLGEDGLPDIVVGSQGAAIVFRSRPVFNLMAHLSFSPKEISTDKIDCVDNRDETLPMVTLTACFNMSEMTQSTAGTDLAPSDTMSYGLNISVMLGVDPMRPTSRGFFSSTNKKERNVTYTYELLDEYSCFNYSIYMPKCVQDILSPIRIKCNFTQVDSESASAVLNMDIKRQTDVEVPFEKHCRKNDTCIAELEVDFNFTTPTLLVAENNYFNVSIKLSNQGDDSYYTSLTMYYPPGLSFSMMTITEATRPTVHSCQDLQVLDKTICDVSHPVFYSKSSATFRASFLILNDCEWKDTISMSVIGKSNNANSTISLPKTIPVQFEINMAVTVKEDPMTYMNFTAVDTGPKKLIAVYKIDNLGYKDFPVNVSLFFPTKLEHNFELTNYQVMVQQNKTQCKAVTDMESKYCTPEKQCKVIVCDIFILEKESPTEVMLSGDVQFKDLKQQAGNIAFLKRYTGDGAEVKFKSFVRVNYDKTRYVLSSHKQQEKSDNDPMVKWIEVRVEFIIPPDQLLIIGTGVGLGLWLLIIITVIMFKLGCFKRKTLEYYQEMEEEAAQQAGSPTTSASAPNYGLVDQSETDSKSDQPAENKTLLDDGNVNGSSPPADKVQEMD